ncbi:MAG TPA: OsmC family protein [Cryomorphaceae bacterium]|nr:OsmC family protein [Cryomorphaceae bacterium]HKL39499.1 OsmC family protein [Cryomorphaceae bacterium]
MNINIARKDRHLHFEAENDRGNRVSIDGGDESKGMRPMELLLTAMGSCSAFDAVLILEKQRQTVRDFWVKVSGTRAAVGEPKPFESIHLIFTLEGEIDKAKAERAVKLSVEKYCSVSATFRPETKITYELKLKA